MVIDSNVFRTPDAIQINHARMRHLASLNLDLDGKRVLEVGAGIGYLTAFFEARECTVLSTDGRQANVDEIRHLYPHRAVETLDLEVITDLSYLGEFDIVFCYGTLYHLKNPGEALQAIAQVCRGLLLLETCVTPGDDLDIHLTPEDQSNPNQAFSGIGCRPTRPWIMQQLRDCFGHAYISRNQPWHHDFDLDWKNPVEKKLHRAIFVGSRRPIENNQLSAELLNHQIYEPACCRIQLEIGASLEQNLLPLAELDPLVEIYAFASDLTTFEQLCEKQPNYSILPIQVGLENTLSQAQITQLKKQSSANCLEKETIADGLQGQTSGSNASSLLPNLRLDTAFSNLNISQVEYLRINTRGADFDGVLSLGDRVRDCLRIQIEVAITDDQLYLGATSRDEVIQYLLQQGFLLIEAQAQSYQQEENLVFVRKDALWMVPELRQKILQLSVNDRIAIAAALATYQPLEPCPGWRFNRDWDKSDLFLQLRRTLWESFRHAETEVCIQFRWVNELVLNLYLGNDFSSQLFIAGNYEPNELYYLSQALAPGMTVLDVGANEGLYALLAASIVQKEGAVVAFEPSPREFQRLQANIELNQNQANIAPIQAFAVALSDANGEHGFKLAESAHSGQNTLGDFAYDIHCEGVVSVKTRRLDDLVQELELSQVDVIKMDIEGAEYAALQGAQHTLETFHPLLFLEVVDGALQQQQTSAEQLIQFLQSLGYQIFYYGEHTALPIEIVAHQILNGDVIAVHPARHWNFLNQQAPVKSLQAELASVQAKFEQVCTQLHNNARFKETMHYQCDHLNRQTQYLQGVKDELERRLQAEEAQGHALQAQVEQQQAQMMAQQAQLAENQTIVANCRAHLEEMSNRIAAMESSKFWQIRTAWINLKRGFGRRGGR